MLRWCWRKLKAALPSYSERIPQDMLTIHKVLAELDPATYLSLARTSKRMYRFSQSLLEDKSEDGNALKAMLLNHANTVLANQDPRVNKWPRNFSQSSLARMPFDVKYQTEAGLSIAFLFITFDIAVIINPVLGILYGIWAGHYYKVNIYDPAQHKERMLAAQASQAGLFAANLVNGIIPDRDHTIRLNEILSSERVLTLRFNS